MSLASKLTLFAAFSTAVGIIYYVQAKQQDDIRRMHEGVVRDVDRQHRRKTENIYLLQQQAELTKMLKKQNRDEETVIKLLEGEEEN